MVAARAVLPDPDGPGTYYMIRYLNDIAMRCTAYHEAMR